MAIFTMAAYVLELFKANHSGHTPTAATTGDGRVRYTCSCGDQLIIDPKQ